MHPIRRWPKGTYMQLISAERLRSFIGPESEKKMSGRQLARMIDKHPSFIDHLLSGRSRSCKPITAQRIARALEVPLDVLFVPATASIASPSGKEQVPA